MTSNSGIADLATAYTPNFYAGQADGSERSAAAVAPVVLGLLPPIGSMVDVGCGVGTWAKVFQQCGVVEVVGIDGSYVDKSQLRIPLDAFKPTDLSKPLDVERTFDLAISLEVAEHLPPERAGSFVSDLTSLATFVIFSAAVPGQGGANHLNEQWPDYWVALFAEHGYRMFDCIRPRIWNDDRVEYWYRQNAFLFVRSGYHVSIPEVKWPLNLVHPEILKVRPSPTLASSSLEIYKIVRHQIRKRMPF